MTIKAIYKVEGDSNEYDSEQEAQVAEAIEDEEGLYVDARSKLKIAKAITKRYFLCPILPTVTIREPVGGQEDPMAEVSNPTGTTISKVFYP